MTHQPDLIVAEMMLNGNLAYIDILCTNGDVVTKSRRHRLRPKTVFETPPTMQHAHDS